MKLVVAAVGRVKEPELRALLDDYYGRVRRYAELSEVELKDEREDRVVAQFERCLAAQGERAELVTLEIEGRPLSSEAFAGHLRKAGGGRMPGQRHSPEALSSHQNIHQNHARTPQTLRGVVWVVLERVLGGFGKFW